MGNNFLWTDYRLSRETKLSLHVITGEDYRATATTPVYDLVLALRKRRMHYLGHMPRLPTDRIVRRSLISLVKGGIYYPEGSLFSDCEVDYLHELIATTTNVITIADDL